MQLPNDTYNRTSLQKIRALSKSMVSPKGMPRLLVTMARWLRPASEDATIRGVEPMSVKNKCLEKKQSHVTFKLYRSLPPSGFHSAHYTHSMKIDNNGNDWLYFPWYNLKKHPSHFSAMTENASACETARSVGLRSYKIRHRTDDAMHTAQHKNLNTRHTYFALAVNYQRPLIILCNVCAYNTCPSHGCTTIASGLLAVNTTVCLLPFVFAAITCDKFWKVQ